MPAPRIAPLAEGQRDEQARELLASAAGQRADQARELVAGAGEAATNNLFATLVRHPDLFRSWFPFGRKLLWGGKLPERHRELLILRTAWLCRAEYAWGRHRPRARVVNVSEEEIARVRAGPDAPGWDQFEAALLRAVDELRTDSRIGEATWAQLAGRYDEHQLIEVPMVIGGYTMLAFTVNSLGVALEPGLTGFDP